MIMIDSYDVLFYIILFGIFALLILAVVFSVKDEADYYYECVTIDGETINCESICAGEAGITGTRDGTTYLIKQYTKKEKKKDE